MRVLIGFSVPSGITGTQQYDCVTYPTVIMADSSEYTIEYRIQAACWWHDSKKDKGAMAEVRRKLQETFDAPPPRGKRVKMWEEKLFSTGSINDLDRSGRPSPYNNLEEAVNKSVNEAPQLSIRQRSEEMGVPYTTLQRQLHSAGFKPFRPTFSQYLSDEDKSERVACCGELLSKYPTRFSRRHFFFSDECAVYGDGRQENLTWWAKENPHFQKQIQNHPPMLMIWAAMSQYDLIGPFFCDGRITAQSYTTMLEKQFIPALMSRHLLGRAILQQDGAPAHTAIATRTLLDKHFPDRWVGKFGPLQWPPRSPDLTSCDNALWGIIKSSIKKKKVEGREQLREAIVRAFTELDRSTLEKIHERSWRRIVLCTVVDGEQVECYDQ